MVRQARALQDIGWRVVIIAPGTAWDGFGPGLELRLINGPVLPGLRIPLRANTRGLRHRVHEALIEERVGLVHVHAEFGLAAAAVDAAHALGVPVVHTSHGFRQAPTRLARSRILAAIARCAIAALPNGLAGTVPEVAPVDRVLRDAVLTIAQRADTVLSTSLEQAHELIRFGLQDTIIVTNAPSTDGSSLRLDQLAKLSLQTAATARPMPEQSPPSSPAQQLTEIYCALLEIYTGYPAWNRTHSLRRNPRAKAPVSPPHPGLTDPGPRTGGPTA